VNGSLLIAMYDIDIVPGLKCVGDALKGSFVGTFQVRERLPGKHDAPAKGVVRPVALIEGDVVRRIGPLHQDREIQSRRAATYDVDFHLL
jgi:hypothetical protein